MMIQTEIRSPNFNSLHIYWIHWKSYLETMLKFNVIFDILNTKEGNIMGGPATLCMLHRFKWLNANNIKIENNSHLRCYPIWFQIEIYFYLDLLMVNICLDSLCMSKTLCLVNATAVLKFMSYFIFLYLSIVNYTWIFSYLLFSCNTNWITDIYLRLEKNEPIAKQKVTPAMQ